MSYFEFDDVRRIHQPYTDAYLRGKLNKTRGLFTFCLSYLYSSNLENANI